MNFIIKYSFTLYILVSYGFGDIHIFQDPKDAILRQYQEEIERLRNLLENKSVTINKDFNSPNMVPEDNQSKMNRNIPSRNVILDSKRDKLIQEYQEEMKRLRNLHENEKNEKEIVLKQIEAIKSDYQQNLHLLNEETETKKEKEICNEEEILKRIETLKAAMIGGEKANDKELSERRRKKKLAAERRARYNLQL